ncbi:MAG: glycosyl transferase, partial [Clostridia bacterium]|nr:glycosyl transferase [Clostridia bacterium]
LSANTAHLRVDFYYVNGKIYAGELTFFHCGGFVEVKPPEWGDIMGNWIAL